MDRSNLAFAGLYDGVDSLEGKARRICKCDQVVVITNVGFLDVWSSVFQFEV